MTLPFISSQVGSAQLGAAQLGAYITFVFLINPPDGIVILYLVPRALCPSVLMPIAYVTEIIADSAGPLGGGPNTSTIPVTGSLTTLIEGNDGEALQTV